MEWGKETKAVLWSGERNQGGVMEWGKKPRWCHGVGGKKPRWCCGVSECHVVGAELE